MWAQYVHVPLLYLDDWCQHDMAVRIDLLIIHYLPRNQYTPLHSWPLMISDSMYLRRNQSQDSLGADSSGQMLLVHGKLNHVEWEVDGGWNMDVQSKMGRSSNFSLATGNTCHFPLVVACAKLKQWYLAYCCGHSVNLVRNSNPRRYSDRT